MSDNIPDLLKELADIYKQLDNMSEKILKEDITSTLFPVYREETQTLNTRADILWNTIHNSGLSVKDINSHIQSLLN